MASASFVKRMALRFFDPKSPAFRTFANGLRFASTYPEKLEFEDIKPDGLSPEPQNPDASSR